MAQHTACLIDVYETVLTVDFTSGSEQLATIAGVPPEAFREASGAVASQVTTGDITMARAMQRILGACGVEPRDELVRDLVAADRELLLESARLHDDTMVFLEMLKTRDVRSALVSNCAENTRPLLTHLGIDALVDSVILSCEVGCAKPSPRIYLRALNELGVGPAATVFVDDQSEYCDGARVLGISAAQIIRNTTDAVRPDRGTAVVQSLMALEDFFSLDGSTGG